MPTHRTATVRSALVDSLDGAIRIDAHGDPVVDVDWLDGVTPRLASDPVQHASSSVVQHAVQGDREQLVAAPGDRLERCLDGAGVERSGRVER